MKINIYHIVVDELPEKLTKSITLVKNYQTYRVAKELVEAVKNTFEFYRLPMQRSIIFEKADFIQIYSNQKITELMLRRKREASLVGLWEGDADTSLKTNSPLIIECRRAYSLPEEKENIRRKEIGLYDDLPIAMRFENEIKIFRKQNYEQELNRLKFS